MKRTLPMSDNFVSLRASHRTDTQVHFRHHVAEQAVFVVNDVILDDPKQGPYQVARVGVRCDGGSIQWIATTAGEARRTEIVGSGVMEWIVSFVDQSPTTPTTLTLRMYANTAGAPATSL